MLDHLINHVNPEHYDLRLKIDRKNRKFSGRVVIQGFRTSLQAPIKLHAKGLTITSALINGQKATFKHDVNDELELVAKNTLKALPVELTLEFSGMITDSMHGMYPCYYNHSGKKKEVIATQFESHHAREVFPCIDEPAAKATFDLTLETEKGVDALSNMPMKHQSEEVDSLTTSFQTSPRMSTYLLAFVIGELHKVSATTSSGVEVNVWATKSQTLESLEFSLDIAKRSVEFFDKYFKTHYPLPKLDNVALPDFGGGAAAAMENWGLITYREDYLLADESTAVSTKQRIGTVITHEISHQWFGNLVTMLWWDDLWLNESFANMMEYVAIDALFPEWKIWTEFAAHESLVALRRDSLPGVQSVKLDVNHPDEINTVFDGAIVYAKGGQLLNMLRHYVGEKAFVDGLEEYFKDHAYQNTKGSDLWRALSKSSGKDIEKFMSAWLEESGYPVINAKLSGSKLTLSQKHFVIGEKPSHRVWPVPLFASSKSLPAVLKTKSATTSVGNELVKLNQDDKSYFITHYDKVLLAKLVDNILKLSEIDRLQILTDANLLARGLLQPASNLIDLLIAYKDETSQPVWDAIAITIGDLKRFVENDKPAEKNLKLFTYQLAVKIYKKFGWEAEPGENEQITKLRACVISLMIYAEDKDAIQQALKRYNAKKDIAKLSGELRTSILVAAVRHSKDTKKVVDELLVYHKKTNSNDLQNDICGALTSTKDKTVIKHLLKLALNEGTIRKQDFPHWFIYLIRNRHGRDIAWQWLIEHWSWIEQSYGSDKGYDLFPRYAAGALNTSEELKKYKAFFEPKRSDIGLKRAIDVGINEINGRIAWLEKDKAAVIEKLRKVV